MPTCVDGNNLFAANRERSRFAERVRAQVFRVPSRSLPEEISAQPCDIGEQAAVRLRGNLGGTAEQSSSHVMMGLKAFFVAARSIR